MPLFVVIAISAIKDLFEDLKRHKQDKEENNRKVLTFRHKNFSEENIKKKKRQDALRK